MCYLTKLVNIIHVNPWQLIDLKTMATKPLEKNQKGRKIINFSTRIYNKFRYSILSQINNSKELSTCKEFERILYE